MTGAGRFLARWSRLKRQVDAPAPAAPPAAPPPAPAPAACAATSAAPVAAAGTAAAELPPLDTLGLDSDFTAFLREEVSESLRRAAMKKLFSDPHFNRMDGLDVYIDDYSVADPIPPDVMERLRQAQHLLRSEEPPAASDAPTPPVPDEPSAQVGAAESEAPAVPEPAEARNSDRASAAPEWDSLGSAGQNVPPAQK